MNMKKLCRVSILALFFLQSFVVAAAARSVGVRSLDVCVSGRTAPLRVTVWYPALPGGRLELVGDGKIFRGVEAWRDAPIEKGRFPLVLVSHGLGGNIAGLSWLTTALARAGFIVAGPNHPGTTAGDSTPEATVRIWERAGDISAVLTSLLDDPAWNGRIDPQRIGALGYSLGGCTVLLLAGARVDLERYARYCEANQDMPDSAWLAGGKVDLRKVDRNLFEKSRLDSRIKTVVVVDPSHAQAFSPQSLREVSATVHILSLGRPSEVWISERPDQIAKARPDFHYEYIDDAVHFSWLAECKPQARDFLASVGEPTFICDDGKFRTRAEIHAQGTAMAIADFWRAWGK